ncbi:ATP-binding protein [Bacillaceae bacterium Marseille-Q3522]|nr:ATP-binding protein [Bacillaceae bacterium Marseille-Q3522]
MKRDPAVLPNINGETFVIACDNSGGIGLKEQDLVKAPYEVVSYYSFRVAAMECIAARAEPIAVVINNFCGEEAWPAITGGVKRGLEELGRNLLPITGSTESNFLLMQSALGVTVIGKREADFHEVPLSLRNRKLAVIGTPLVGKEVLEKANEVLPLSLFQDIFQFEQIVVIPAGSKGIIHEIEQIFTESGITTNEFSCDVDLYQSAGPATCILAVFPKKLESSIVKLASLFYHPIFPR